ncbi:MAG: hypothetical protein JSC189_000662 [Candidatus Tokpelaia sp. JSC189]|nr:MAG: hypothetical protein JSC189_000662 [Candidatus Tokpelaia sp. JSC189]
MFEDRQQNSVSLENYQRIYFNTDEWVFVLAATALAYSTRWKRLKGN